MTSEKKEESWDWPNSGNLSGFKRFLEGIDGFPSSYSEYKQQYASVGFETDYTGSFNDLATSQHKLECRLMQVLLKCRERGAELIVWREKPSFMVEGVKKHRVYARFHCVPAVAFDDEDIRSEGEPFKPL